jgi:hypothetical protein
MRSVLSRHDGDAAFGTASLGTAALERSATLVASEYEFGIGWTC